MSILADLAVAFVGGLTGAFGGALGAQHIAERARRREDMLRELRLTNASIMASFSICNSALVVKDQHAQPMFTRFEKDKTDLEEFYRRRAAGELPANTQYEFAADMRAFPALVLPIDTLKKLVFEQISASGRPLALVAVIDQTAFGLKNAIEKRDGLVSTLKTGAIPKELFAHHYFGLKLPNGDLNQEYPDTVRAIHSYVDDLAFFSSLLCADLIKHGNRLRAALVKRSEKGVPRVSTADFSASRAKGLLPPEEQYADWLKGFKVHDEEPSRKWWQWRQ